MTGYVLKPTGEVVKLTYSENTKVGEYYATEYEDGRLRVHLPSEIFPTEELALNSGKEPDKKEHKKGKKKDASNKTDQGLRVDSGKEEVRGLRQGGVRKAKGIRRKNEELHESQSSGNE